MVVYPRWRGEHWLCNSSTHDHVGLSPLARGTLLCRFHITGLPRFIPAGAGNTTVQTAGYYFFAVYPRWRGEHLLLELVECCYSGLSPLARGTLLMVSFLQLAHRFIPAGAGNTAIYGSSIIISAVYPRWRGEHTRRIQRRRQRRGLSPLARGTLFFQEFIFLIERFIPAGAGNTYSACLRTRSTPVYPRWRGEHERMNFSGITRGGLSPLARGTPFSITARNSSPRFIPAGAGNTLNITYY